MSRVTKPQYRAWQEAISTGVFIQRQGDNLVVSNASPTRVIGRDPWMKSGNALESIPRNLEAVVVVRRPGLAELGRDRYFYGEASASINKALGRKVPYFVTDTEPDSPVYKIVGERDAKLDPYP